MSSKRKRPKTILVAFGTRPEAVKLAPVILDAQQDPRFSVVTCLTAQHREMVDQVLKFFQIKTDFDLNLMQKSQSLSGLTRRLFPKIEAVLKHVKPDLVMVQGDTTTAFGVALQAFYARIPVAHVEAGLRTHDKAQPFPEEMNRVLISHLADYHFAPTKGAAANLRREGIPPGRLYVTGNTVVDILQRVKPALKKYRPRIVRALPQGQQIVLVTAHRRESFGPPLASICRSLRKIAALHQNCEIIYPVHLNPRVQKTVFKILKDVKRIHLTPPFSYAEFLSLMNDAHLILTDSGGIQEEAPSFAKPVLVMRDVSERPDGIQAGIARLVGTSQARIVGEAGRFLKNGRSELRFGKMKNPYGDGYASKRILNILARELKGRGAS